MQALVRYAFVAALCASTGNLTLADIKLPAIFGDHMVLQRDLDLPVWGWADPGENVTVTAGSAKASTTTKEDGSWSVKLPELKASTTPVEVTIQGKNTITLHDVLVGDVWLCSGQSNMEFGIKAFMHKDELAQANQPLIRLFGVPKVIAPAPAKDIGPAPEVCPTLGKWYVCTPEGLLSPANGPASPRWDFILAVKSSVLPDNRSA